MSIHCAICGYAKEITEDFRQWPLIGDAVVDIYPVTRRGRPSGEVRGFICASCLQSAKSMRLHVKSLMEGIRVTDHALERYISRCTKGAMGEESAKSGLIKEFSHARKVRFKEYYMVERMLNNNSKGANYYFGQGFIYVTTQDEPLTILTVESAKDKRIGKDFWYID